MTQYITHMEVDGMYQNTPWERLALWAPWLALAVLATAIVSARVVTQRTSANSSAAVFTNITQALSAFGLALATLGTLFTVLWRPAHDTYPYAFGRAAIGTAIGSVVGALLGVALRRAWVRPASTYGMLTAAAATAVAIAAFSHSIIAEGQVTAMVLPVAYVVCAIGATMVASAMYRDAAIFEASETLVFLALAFVATQLLPVVQFREDSSLYPVTGAFYIVAIGRVARASVFPLLAMGIIALAAIAIGYLLASWYGVAIAAVGLSISGSWDPRRQTSGESLPLR